MASDGKERKSTREEAVPGLGRKGGSTLGLQRGYEADGHTDPSGHTCRAERRRGVCEGRRGAPSGPRVGSMMAAVGFCGRKGSGA